MQIRFNRVISSERWGFARYELEVGRVGEVIAIGRKRATEPDDACSRFFYRYSRNKAITRDSFISRDIMVMTELLLFRALYSSVRKSAGQL